MWGRDAVDAIGIEHGLPFGGLRIAVALVACCFVAPLVHAFRSESARHVFNAAAGIYAGVFVFDAAILHMIAWAVGVYLLLILAPRRMIGNFVLVTMFAYLVAVHCYREYKAPDIVWDAAQMLLTLKISSVAINYSDGGRVKDKQTSSMALHAMIERPGLLPFLSYCFFFPTFLAGPIFEFKDYVKWIKEARFAPARVHARNVVVFLVSALGFFISLSNPVNEIDSSTFLPDAGWAKRCVCICVRVALYRFRYYMLWSLAEAASVLAGIGYVAETGKWNGITNSDILCVEVPTNIRVGINYWNMGVARWLNAYIYQRVALSRSGKPTMMSTMSVFFVSAMWHGISPCYYLFFILGGVYTEVGKHLRRRLRPFFHYTEDRNMYPHAIFLSYGKGKSHPLAFFYDLAGMFISWIVMQYAGVAFMLLDVRRTMAVWASWYFLPHIIGVGLLVVLPMLPSPKRVSVDKKGKTE